MNKAENVIKYYVLCNTLKDVIRTGWKDWQVKRERIESVAEHIYGVQMLAIAMKYEYGYDVDIYKVILMLAIHELEEIYIGDLTQFQISKEEKKKLGHEAVQKILGCLLDSEQLLNLIYEYDERKTKEADFAYHCDKLECDLQCRLYDEEGCVDLNNQQENSTFNIPDVQKILQDGSSSWSQMWLSFGQERYHYDENFTAVSNYAKEHKIRNFQNKCITKKNNLVELKDLKMVNKNVNLDEYISFRELVKENMEHPEWLGDFSKEDLIKMQQNNSIIWIYYLDKEPVCSMMLIPSTEKDLKKFEIDLNAREVVDYGPMFVNPKFVGNGLQYQMLKELDNYCLGLGYKYAVGTIHPDNIYSISNLLKDEFELIGTKLFTRGIRNIYLKCYQNNDK